MCQWLKTKEFRLVPMPLVGLSGVPGLSGQDSGSNPVFYEENKKDMAGEPIRTWFTPL
jgi:hypothetical protein